jgi:serine/threonine protein kinase
VSSQNIPPPNPEAVERLRRELTTPSAALKSRARFARSLWAVPLAVAAIVAATGYFGGRAIDKKLVDQVKGELESRRDACSQALQDWVKLEKSLAKLIADRRLFREIAPRAIAAGSAAADAKLIEEAIGEATQIGGFEAYAVLDSAGRFVNRSREFRLGPSLHLAQANQLGRVLEDDATRLLPMSTTVGGAEGVRKPVLLVATPIKDENGQGVGVLALQMAHARDFSRVVYEARTGDTGENFIFDRDGRMLSNSRFDDQLRAVGLLAPGEASAGNLEIRDPGGNLFDGYRPTGPRRTWPLSWAVAHVDERPSGVNMTPFRDYRGVPVVAAYEWISALDLGVVAKMDAAEAFETLGFFKSIFWTLCGLLIAAAVLMSFGAVVLQRLRARSSAPRQVGPYSLMEKIGEGAMGSVYKATHAMLRRPTAVKLLEAWSAEAAPRFEREAQLTSQLTHPNTIAIYDYGRTPDGVFYYAMEHVEGIDLNDLVQYDGPMPPARVIHVLRQVCGSLAEAHALGLVHRDIKPSNIMLTVRGGEADVAKVLDFGLARLVEAPPGAQLTRAGAIFGTPGFIPPETLKDPATFDPRGDLYSVGAMAYELLSGLPPFDRTNALEMWHLHVEVDPPPPSVRLGSPIPRVLEETVMTLLSKDPALRPDDAFAVIDLLDLCARVVGPWTQADARAWWERRGKAIAQQAAKARAASQPGTTRRYSDRKSKSGPRRPEEGGGAAAPPTRRSS